MINNKSNKEIRKESKTLAKGKLKAVLPISIILTLFLSMLFFGPFRITPSDTYLLGGIKITGHIFGVKNTDKIVEGIEKRRTKIQEKFSYGKFSNQGMISDAYHITLRDGTSLTVLLANMIASRFLDKDEHFDIVLIIALLIFTTSLTFLIFPVSVGVKRFFIERVSLEAEKLKISSYLTYSFKSKHYLNICFVLFYRNLILLLSFFTIILFPIKYYQYYQVPYLLAKNPTITRRDAIRQSKLLMKNRKFGAFILDLSFLPLRILSLLTFNLLNILFADPYYEMTKAAYFYQLNDSSIEIEQKIYDEDEYEIDYKKRKMYSVDSLILMFFLFSFIGYVWEVFFIFFKMDLLVNRGSLYGPYIPVYGFAGVTLVIIFSKLRNHPVIIFILTLITCGVIEYVSALFCENVFHEVFWDYSGYFLNIGGRVSLEGVLLFGILGMFAIYIAAPVFNHFLKKFNFNTKRIICVILITVLVIDLCFSIIYPRSGPGISN